MTEKQTIQNNHITETERIPVAENISYTTNHPSGQYTAERSFNSLWERIKLSSGQQAKVRRMPYWGYAAAAASIAVLVVVGLLVVGNTAEPEIYTLNVETGRQQFTLPDGTQVWLNTGSRLSYNESFGKKVREVELVGEAYFDVTKNALKPFVVKLEKINVQVLGTEFNVSCYPGDSTIATTLIEGSVRIDKVASPAEDNVTLKPGQQLLFERANEGMSIKDVDGLLFTAWKDGHIIFKHTPVEEAFKMIERDFRITIITKNKRITGRTVTGRFSLDEKPEDILKVMQETLPFNYRIVNDTIYID